MFCYRILITVIITATVIFFVAITIVSWLCYRREEDVMMIYFVSVMIILVIFDNV